MNIPRPRAAMACGRETGFPLRPVLPGTAPRARKTETQASVATPVCRRPAAVMAITKCLIPALTVSGFTVSAESVAPKSPRSLSVSQ